MGRKITGYKIALVVFCLQSIAFSTLAASAKDESINAQPQGMVVSLTDDQGTSPDVENFRKSILALEPSAKMAETQKHKLYKDMGQSHEQIEGIDPLQYASFEKTKAELERVYNRVLHVYAADKLFIQKLKAAQQAWLDYVDAYLESRFPEPDKISAYGSAFHLCAAQIRQRFNQARIKELKEWLNGVEEGDLCAGSIHTK